MKNKNSPLGKFIGNLALGILTLGVFMFLASHSLNFFQFTFGEEDQLYAYLGILLTSGGAIGWLMIFMWNADTTMRRGIALIMMGVAILAELVTAVYDMQYNGLYNSVELSTGELRTMTSIIGVFGAITGIALAAYVAGDKIGEAFRDDDGDGIPNVFDRHDNRQNTPRRPQEAPRAPQPPAKAVYADESESETLEAHPTMAGK